MNLFNLGIAFIAGLLTALSPCVLPVLPFVIASSLNKSRLGPIALALGLLIMFVSSTLLISISGYFFGLEPYLIRKIAGVLLALSGVLFLWQRALDKLSLLFSYVINKASQASKNNYSSPLVAEFIAGLLLGVVWTPCSGPSLGVALSLAAQAGSTFKALVILSIFGFGAVIPLMAFSYGARGLLTHFKRNVGILSILKKAFGGLMVLYGLLIILGWDKIVEALLTQLLPDSWIGFVTHF